MGVEARLAKLEEIKPVKELFVTTLDEKVFYGSGRAWRESELVALEKAGLARVHIISIVQRTAADEAT